MSEIAAALVNAVRARKPEISDTDLEHVRQFGHEVEAAAQPVPGQAPGEITFEEGRDLAASRHLVGAGARPALTHVLNSPAPRDGHLVPGQLWLSPTARLLLAAQRGAIADRMFIEGGRYPEPEPQ